MTGAHFLQPSIAGTPLRALPRQLVARAGAARVGPQGAELPRGAHVADSDEVILCRGGAHPQHHRGRGKCGGAHDRDGRRADAAALGPEAAREARARKRNRSKGAQTGKS